MHLAPQHFQAQRRYHEDALARAVDALFPFAWGVVGVELDADALRNGTLRLVHVRGILPDGTAFHLPDADPMPAAAGLAERFAPTREAHVVHLALARWRPDGANVDEDGDDGEDGRRRGGGAGADDAPAGHAADSWGAPERGPTRFVARTRVTSDETTGADALPVRFAARRFRLLLDDEVAADDVTLPLARVRRDGAGHFVFDPAFVPPCLQLCRDTRPEVPGGAPVEVPAAPRATAATRWPRAGCCTPCARRRRRCATC
jgi:type VI secretion system protein ImpJ